MEKDIVRQNKFVKHEVIELANTVDVMADLIVKQD